MVDFSGRTVLVTGGGSGIGAATCRAMAAASANPSLWIAKPLR